MRRKTIYDMNACRRCARGPQDEGERGRPKVHTKCYVKPEVTLITPNFLHTQMVDVVIVVQLLLPDFEPNLGISMSRKRKKRPETWHIDQQDLHAAGHSRSTVGYLVSASSIIQKIVALDVFVSSSTTSIRVSSM